jgi:hypothetical protein
MGNDSRHQPDVSGHARIHKVAFALVYRGAIVAPIRVIIVSAQMIRCGRLASSGRRTGITGIW